NLHTGNMFYSGYAWQEEPRAFLAGEARRPAVGSVVSRLRPGPKDIPPYVSIENAHHWERAYYLGNEHEPLRVGSWSSREAVENMGRHRDVSEIRLSDLQDLMQGLDSVRRSLDLGDLGRGIDRFQRRALVIVTSSRVREAFDLEK